MDNGIKTSEKRRGFIASLPLFSKIFYVCGIVSVFLYFASMPLDFLSLMC